MSDFGVVTIATGRNDYLRMACALALSVRRNSPRVPTCVLTDSRHINNSKLQECFDFVLAFDSSVPRGVLSKLYIDMYSPFERTMFIDSDSLVYGDLRPVMAAFAGIGEFSLIEYGEPVTASTRDYYGAENPAAALAAYDLQSFPQLHSGILCFQRGPHARRVFETAREAIAQVDKLGLKPFGVAAASDEPLLALALSRLGLHGYRGNERSRHLRVAISNDPGLADADVTKGLIPLRSSDGERFSPAVIHFHWYGSEYFVYRRELFALLGVAGLRGRTVATFAAGAEWGWRSLWGSVRRLVSRARSAARRTLATWRSGRTSAVSG